MAGRPPARITPRAGVGGQARRHTRKPRGRRGDVARPLGFRERLGASDDQGSSSGQQPCRGEHRSGPSSLGASRHHYDACLCRPDAGAKNGWGAGSGDRGAGTVGSVAAGGVGPGCRRSSSGARLNDQWTGSLRGECAATKANPDLSPLNQPEPAHHSFGHCRLGRLQQQPVRGDLDVGVRVSC